MWMDDGKDGLDYRSSVGKGSAQAGSGPSSGPGESSRQAEEESSRVGKTGKRKTGSGWSGYGSGNQKNR